MMVGMLFGEFLAGVLTIFLPQRGVLSGFMILNFFAAILLIGGGRGYVKEIYNRQA